MKPKHQQFTIDYAKNAKKQNGPQDTGDENNCSYYWRCKTCVGKGRLSDSSVCRSCYGCGNVPLSEIRLLQVHREDSDFFGFWYATCSFNVNSVSKSSAVLFLFRESDENFGWVDISLVEKNELRYFSSKGELDTFLLKITPLKKKAV